MAEQPDQHSISQWYVHIFLLGYSEQLLIVDCRRAPQMRLWRGMISLCPTLIRQPEAPTRFTCKVSHSLSRSDNIFLTYNT
jgi:hypothetical protein